MTFPLLSFFVQREGRDTIIIVVVIPPIDDTITLIAVAVTIAMDTVWVVLRHAR